MEIRIKKVHSEAIIPRFAHPGDAGMDLFAVEETIIAPGERVQIPTGLAFELPDGHVGLVWDKSGLSHNHGLKTLGGVLDAGYRGELLVGLVNLSTEIYTIERGDKIAQLLIQKIERPDIVEMAELSDSSRGIGGFGSTGK
ncbi:MAG TPA: dUTP diphosphatase [Candidatus Paceibacterota bacterium]|nr:dUTP diphosphatase [Candidatus Paceibacterota bacterium]